jgi:hypothetical protein
VCKGDEDEEYDACIALDVIVPDKDLSLFPIPIRVSMPCFLNSAPVSDTTVEGDTPPEDEKNGKFKGDDERNVVTEGDTGRKYWAPRAPGVSADGVISSTAAEAASPLVSSASAA